MTSEILVGDCLKVLPTMEPDSVDLVFTSPPYEDARQYGIDFKLKGEEWVAWAIERYLPCLRVCRGLVAWVVEGKTRNYVYSATPILMMADLHRRGVFLRKPPAFHRVGIPGSGGPDWLRNDWEPVICATRNRGRLPWSDNKAMGGPPKYEQGGLCSNRHADGRRANTQRYGANDGKSYAKPDRTNPGNVVKCKVGGGHMGSKLAHETEAPFPEVLADFFIRSFCPPGGTVLDPFGGSGTTMAAAIQAGRNAISIDVRESQIKLMNRRELEARRRIEGDQTDDE